MGGYVTYTVRGEDQQVVAAALRGRCATVSPVENGAIVVWDEESNGQDDQVILTLGRHLSVWLKSTVWAALVHDDDILQYRLFTGGERSDAYNSNPTYFFSDPSPPSGGDAAKLCQSFHSNDTDRVEEILRWMLTEDDDRYAFESERHQALVDVLGLPSLAIGFNFWQALEKSDHPEDDGFVKVG